MKESHNIANRFADAYIVAMLENSNAEEVIRHYEAMYPELQESFKRNAKDLELLYGYVRKSELPSEKEIASAYAKLRSRMAPLTPAATAAAPEPRLTFSQKVRTFLQVRPAIAGASFGLGLAVLLALFWQPWMQGTPQEVTSNDQQVTTPSAGEQTPQTTITDANKPGDSPVSSDGPTFRGADGASQEDKALLDKKDRTRLSKLAVDNSLGAPVGVKVIGAADSVIVVSWAPVKNALSYIVEIKRANEGQFKAVSQTSQTQARISGLPSSERMEIRIIATSGERKGEASAAKNITVP